MFLYTTYIEYTYTCHELGDNIYIYTICVQYIYAIPLLIWSPKHMINMHTYMCIVHIHIPICIGNIHIVACLYIYVYGTCRFQHVW